VDGDKLVWCVQVPHVDQTRVCVCLTWQLSCKCASRTSVNCVKLAVILIRIIEHSGKSMIVFVCVCVYDICLCVCVCTILVRPILCSKERWQRNENNSKRDTHVWVCVCIYCLRLQSVNNARVCLCLCVCYILLFTNWQLTGTTLDNWLNIYRIYIGENQTIYKGRERERVVCVFFVVGRVKKYNFAVLRWIDPYNNAQKAFFLCPAWR